VIAGQLELDLADAMQDDLQGRIRASVTEPDMSDAEIDAAVADALKRLGLRTKGSRRARPCECVRVPMVFLDALAVDRRCARCGREPRR
jgi:hypothetical protein